MKKLLGTIALCLACSTGAGKVIDDPVLMKINGKDITRSEFEYSFNKNNTTNKAEQTSLDAYVDMYINYKLKVEDALAARLDTTASFRKEFENYRDMQLTPMLIDTMYIDSVARQLYGRLEQRMGGKDLIHPAHIFFRLPQDAPQAYYDSVKQRVDSIYALVKGGADFALLARQNSEDRGTAHKGGQLQWIGPGSTIKAFEDAAYKLKDGETSQPIESPVGFHIIRMNGRRPLESYAELKPTLVKALEQRDIKEKSGEHTIQKMISASHGKLTRDMVIDSLLNKATAQDPTLKYLIQEYYDGLLLYDISKAKVWDKAANDTVGLEKYFKEHKKSYKWTEPRFKGFLFYTTDKKLIKPVAKMLRKIKDNSWDKAIDKAFNTDSTERVKVMIPDYFKKGDNKYVDELVFDGPQVKRPDGFDYIGVAGKKLKNPKELNDAMGMVIGDYQEELERQWVESLRKKYTFEVNKEILKTVNNHND